MYRSIMGGLHKHCCRTVLFLQSYIRYVYKQEFDASQPVIYLDELLSR